MGEIYCKNFICSWSNLGRNRSPRMAGPRTRDKHFLVGVDDQDGWFESQLQLFAHCELGTGLCWPHWIVDGAQVAALVLRMSGFDDQRAANQPVTPPVVNGQQQSPVLTRLSVPSAEETKSINKMRPMASNWTLNCTQVSRELNYCMKLKSISRMKVNVKVSELRSSSGAKCFRIKVRTRLCVLQLHTSRQGNTSSVGGKFVRQIVA